TPGLALALTSRTGPLRVSTYGYRDVEEGTPVTSETLFQIGSISKTFTAIALLRLHEDGRLDLHSPIVEYLPWLRINPHLSRITAHHLLTHTSGLPRDGDLLGLPEMLRNWRAEYEPGVRSIYSNVGYQLLGYVLEQLTGLEYGAAIQNLVFQPLGFVASEPVITYGIRTRAASGYLRFTDDSGKPEFVRAPWFEYRLGDGSIAATPEDLATFVQMLLNRGGMPSNRLISDETFSKFAQKTVPAHGPHDGLYSGYGIAVQNQDDRTILWHAGGMPGFTSMLMGDMTTGLGVVVLANGPGDTSRHVADFALSTLRLALQEQDVRRSQE
ncbi:MAG: serine hydrolase domain-containing protein, partial [Acidobacteriota bacterium]